MSSKNRFFDPSICIFMVMGGIVHQTIPWIREVTDISLGLAIALVAFEWVVAMMTTAKTGNSADNGLAFSSLYIVTLCETWLLSQLFTADPWTEAVGTKNELAIFGMVAGLVIYTLIVIADRKGTSLFKMFVAWAKKAYGDEPEKSPTPRL